MVFIIIIILIIIAYEAIKIISYNRTSYKKTTHNSYFQVVSDKGRLGEYDTYKYLKAFEDKGYKFLFNLYLPKRDGKTTEIDVLMIGQDAVYVFESKNYSGWIFGNDTQKTWTQVLPKGKGRSQKERFYNPVWQNKTHCEALRQVLPEDVSIRSVVLFSNRCTFKDLTINSKNVVVTHRRNVKGVVEGMERTVQGSSHDVNRIYEILYPFSQVPEEVKQSHIDDVSSFC